MYILLIVLHVISCLVLIGVILLQAGKGGGLAEEFGGGGGGFQSILGTKTSKFLTRATAVCAVLFLATSLSLSFISIKQKGSLVEREVLKESQKQPAARTAPQKTEAAPQQPSPESK